MKKRPSANEAELSNRAAIALLDEGNSSLAWRLLSSPLSFLSLAFLMSLMMALSAFVPQVAESQAFVKHFPFALARGLKSFGLHNFFSSWPFFLLLTLMLLNLYGLYVAKSGHANRKAQESPKRIPLSLSLPEAKTLLSKALKRSPETLDKRYVWRYSFTTTGIVLLLMGTLLLLTSRIASSSLALDAELSLSPGKSEPSIGSVRQDEVLIRSQMPLSLFCEHPDPQDPQRAFPCESIDRQGQKTTLTLIPGQHTKLGPYTLTPLRQKLRRPQSDDAYALFWTGKDAARMTLFPGETKRLKDSQVELTAYPGPDGPLLVKRTPNAELSLLMPSFSASPKEGSLQVEYPSQLTVALQTAPLFPFYLAGALLMLLALLLLAFLPKRNILLEDRGKGTELLLEGEVSEKFERSLYAALKLPPKEEGSQKRPADTSLSTALSLALLALALGSLILGLGRSFSSPALAFFVASLPLYRQKSLIPLAALSLIAALGTSPSPIPPSFPTLFGLVIIGLGLGLSVRSLGKAPAPKGRPHLQVALYSFGLSLLFLLPSFSLSGSLLESGESELSLLVSDGFSSMTSLWPFPLFVQDAALPWYLLAALGFPLTLLFLILREHPHHPRAGLFKNIALGFASLSILFGLFRFVSHSFGGKTLSGEALRQQLSLQNSDLSFFQIQDLHYALSSSSLPFIDGLIILLGGLLLATLLRKDAPQKSTQSSPSEGRTLRFLLAFWLLLAFFFFALTQGLEGPSYLVLAGALLLSTLSFYPRRPFLKGGFSLLASIYLSLALFLPAFFAH